jgi:hypothetical protein
MKALAGFLAIVALIVAGFQVTPPILANYSFQDDLKNVAMTAGANPSRTDEEVRNDVLRKSKEHQLPIKPEQVTIQRIGSPGLMAVYVVTEYSVPVNLPGYSFDMHFSPTSGNKGF